MRFVRERAIVDRQHEQQRTDAKHDRVELGLDQP
jgi:hypothetical protein